MSGLHGFGNWMLSFTARLLFWYGIKDSQSGMWVFRKRIFENEAMRPTNDGMPLSRKSKSSRGGTLASGRPLKSPYRTDRVLGTQKSTRGATAGRT